jgi:predicted small secreted protein
MLAVETRKGEHAMKLTIKLLLLAAIGSSTLLLAACNTTKGVGQDMRSAGESISHEAKKDGAHGD